MKLRSLVPLLLIAGVSVAPTGTADAAKPDAVIDGTWIGTEVGAESKVVIKINTKFNTMMFVDEAFVYFGKIEAKKKVGKKGAVYQTKTTVTNIVDISGEVITNAKVPAVSYARWRKNGDKLLMCAGAPGTNKAPLSTTKPGNRQIRCFKLQRA